MKLRVAYGSIPKDCGTFTFYRNLKSGLRSHHIELFCVSAGQQEAQAWNSSFADASCVQLVPDEPDRKRQAQAFVAWTEREQIDLVMPINSVALLSALPHLPSRLQAVMRCANAFDHGYRITVLHPDRVARIVATTPRHVHDLTNAYGADPNKLVLIPHGIDPGPFEQLPGRVGNVPLTLGFLGRLEHNQKGVLYLPGIVERLGQLEVPFTLKIAGVGVHRPRMERLMANAVTDGRVQFVGRLTPNQVPQFLAGIDLFLFPSRFEGFGFSLVEAMMAGCVPVASRIEGITDFILEEGRTGLLCGIGAEEEFVQSIVRLHAQRHLLETMSAAAARTARERFTSERMASDYARLFTKLVSAQTPGTAPQPWAFFRLPKPLCPTWRSRLPQPIRRFLRSLRDALPGCARPESSFGIKSASRKGTRRVQARAA